MYKSISASIVRVCCLLLSFVTFGQDFVHPGGLFKQSDLDRMRYMVEAGVEPYVTSFSQLQADSKSSYNYVVQGNSSLTRVSRGGENGREWEADANAAYHNALMWAITQDERHAQKCVEIFNAWKNITYVGGTGTYPLNAGLFVWKMVEAAEIVEHTYIGWATSDIQDFKDMLVYPGYSDTAVPSSVDADNEGSFYWRIYMGDTGRHGNQDLIAYRGMLIMGIFLDNKKMYDRALNYFTGKPGRTDDLPMPTGPSPSGSQIADNEYFTTFSYQGSTGAQENYGYNGVLEHYIWENGQCQEASRDQGHLYLGLGMVTGMAELAWNQGEDVWNMLDNRILKGYEHMSRYNVSYHQSYEDQPDPWEPDPNVGTGENAEFIQRLDRTGRWFSKSMNPYYENNFSETSRGDFLGSRPVYEQAWAHFDVRMGQGSEAKWTKRGLDYANEQAGYEQTGFSLDHPGWGAICFRRPTWAAGDPVTDYNGGAPVYGVLTGSPLIVEAENYDHFPIDGEGRTYHDLTTGNAGAAYREDDVDIKAIDDGFALTDLDNGEWYNYTVNIEEVGTYSISANYASANGSGTIKFAVGGSDVTEAVSLPATGGLTTYADHTVSSEVELLAGVQVFRVYVGGTGDSFDLDGFTITFLQGNSVPSVTITSPSAGGTYTEGETLVIAADASDEDGMVSRVDFYIGEHKIGEDNTAPYEISLEYLPVGSHTFSAKAIDDKNATGSSSQVSIDVGANSQSTESIDLGSVDDTYVNSADASANFGSNETTVTKWTATNHRYAYYKFDLNGIFGPITSAKLKLNVRSADKSSTRSVYRVFDDSWKEETLNFGNQPERGEETANISISTSDRSTYVEWDVTEYVALENSIDGFVTFVIADPAVTDSGIDFYTKESAEDRRPILSVNYKGSVNQEPSVSITAPANGQTFEELTNITIEAEASDSDGTVELVEFYHRTTKLGEDDTFPYSFEWTNVALGDYDLSAIATDNIGAQTTSELVSISVIEPANLEPTASIISPEENAVFEAGSNVKIEATASDTDGTVVKVEFYRGDTKLGEDSSAPYSATWLNAEEGDYALKAIAVDDRGGKGVSETVSIVVGDVEPPLAVLAAKGMKLYPNPAGKATTLTFNLNQPESFVIQIMNINGQVVRSFKTRTFQQGTNHLNLNLEDLSNGLYLINLKGTVTATRLELIIID